ncbi:MAG: hypothetical protein ACREXG_10130 [Polaromonas sp.]
MNFYKCALREFAASMAPGVRRALEKTIIDAYQSAAAHGVTDGEGVIKEWDELGAILSSDHQLREMALGELRSKIDAALKGLAYADELALWFAYGSAIEFLDVNDASEYDGMGNDSDGRHEVIEHICRRIAKAAMDDWETRPPAPVKSDDEAYLQTLIDGTADMFADDILERIEPMFTTYEHDAAMMDLLNRAAMAFSDSAVNAAHAALAAQGSGSHEPTAGDGVNIVILKVTDKDGNRLTDLEDAP